MLANGSAVLEKEVFPRVNDFNGVNKSEEDWFVWSLMGLKSPGFWRVVDGPKWPDSLFRMKRTARAREHRQEGRASCADVAAGGLLEGSEL